MDILFWILVGAFIGWHVPQPTWAVALKMKVLSMFKGADKS
jgi:hypothetical protein